MRPTTWTTKANTSRAQVQVEGNPDPPLLTSSPLGWNGVIAERYRHATAEHVFPIYSENTAALYLGEPVSSVRWSGDGFYEGPTSKGDVTVKTSGEPAGWRFDGEVELLVMRFAPAFLLHLAEENELDSVSAELQPSFDRRDETVERLGLAMLTEIESGGITGRVYGDALSTALATHLLRNYAAPRSMMKGKGGLPKSTLRLVKDFIGENLAMDLGLAELAGVANLSSYHFSRQFRRSTGLSPHQYVICRRVERAHELLSKTDLSVGDVARAVGFTHQSHLAYHVRRRFGVAPSSLRS